MAINFNHKTNSITTDTGSFSIGDGTLKILDFVEDASAANYFEMENQAAGSGPILRSTGSDTDVDLILDTKGAGKIILGNITADSTISIEDDTTGRTLTIKGGTGTAGDGGDLILLPGSGSTAVDGIVCVTDDDGGNIMCFEGGNAAIGVNYLNVKNNIALGAPVIETVGSDTNIDLILDTKGTGVVSISSGIVLGGGTPMLGMFGGSIVHDFPSIAAGASSDTPSISVSTTVTTSVPRTVSIGLPSAPPAGIVFNAFVSGTGTVVIRATNITGDPIDPASATYYVTVTLF